MSYVVLYYCKIECVSINSRVDGVCLVVFLLGRGGIWALCMCVLDARLRGLGTAAGRRRVM